MFGGFYFGQPYFGQISGGSNFVDITKTLQYRVLVQRQINLGLSYTVGIPPVPITKALTYEIAPRFAITKDLQYAVLTSDVISLPLTYVIRMRERALVGERTRNIVLSERDPITLANLGGRSPITLTNI